MKKLTFIAGCAALLLPLVSCNEEKADFTYNKQYLTSNLFTPRNTSAEPFVTSCFYLFDFVGTKSVSVSSTNLMFEGMNHVMSVSDVPIKVQRYTDGDLIILNKASGQVDAGMQQITNFNCRISGLFYRKQSSQPTVSNTFADYHPFVIATYNIGTAYSVATFQPDVTYRGVTTTTFEYQGQNQVYKTKSGHYRVVMDLDKLTADVVLYNVKFAEQAPALILILKDLKINLERGGYVIEGTNFNPNQSDGNILTPNDSFPFESFKLRTTSEDLTNVSIEYTVRNKAMEDKLGNGTKVYYYGSFTGSYINDPQKPFNPDTPVED